MCGIALSNQYSYHIDFVLVIVIVALRFREKGTDIQYSVMLGDYLSVLQEEERPPHHHLLVFLLAHYVLPFLRKEEEGSKH